MLRERVCVCVKEVIEEAGVCIERERERESESEIHTERKRERECVCV